ncbi:MAG: non-heme iron oxygenase ferredoxin subunit [Pirellulaceae bacterium]
MSEFARVARVSEIPAPGKRVLEVEDRIVVLLHIDGQFYCIDDVCTHDGGTLGDGELCGHALACPRHGAKFDVRNGKALTMPATEDTVVHEVKVEGDDIYVRLGEE